VVSGLVATGTVAVFVTFAVSRMRAVGPPLIDRRVLVVPFENRTGEQELDALGDAAADNLSRDLVAARLADVVEPREVGDWPAHSSGQSVHDAARHHGAGRVLRGTYYRQGDSLRFEPQIIDSRSGKTLEPLLPVVVSASGGAAAVEPLRQRVLAGFAVLGDTLFDGWAVASHPATYDAYLEFVASARTGTVDTRTQDEHLARANRLDSGFTMPLVRLTWQGNGGCRVADSIVKRLGARLDRLPVYDRAGITKNQAHCYGWRDREFKAARDMYDAAPDADGIVLQFAYAARHTNHVREALRATERLDPVRHRSDRFYWGNRIIPYHLLEMYDSELIAARQLNRAVPDNWEGMAFEGRALAALGRVDELRSLLDRMESVALNTDQVGTPTGWMRDLGRELYVHGHVAEARLVFERVLTWFRSHSTPADPGMQEEFARALYDAGRWDEAWDAAQRALRADTTSMAVRTLLGAIAARRGDRRTVDRTDVWLGRLTGPYLHGDNTYERARLAAILGERVHADALLKQALDEGYAVPFGVGPHDDPDFDSIRDMAAYRLLYRDKP
jgi:TolB-like protein/tetratricopeptide (TPR) repeat protein